MLHLVLVHRLLAYERIPSQAHLAPVTSMEAVERVMATLLTNGKVQRATHNIMAYRIAVPAKGTYLQVRFWVTPAWLSINVEWSTPARAHAMKPRTSWCTHQQLATYPASSSRSAGSPPLAPNRKATGGQKRAHAPRWCHAWQRGSCASWPQRSRHGPDAGPVSACLLWQRKLGCHPGPSKVPCWLSPLKNVLITAGL